MRATERLGISRLHRLGVRAEKVSHTPEMMRENPATTVSGVASANRRRPGATQAAGTAERADQTASSESLSTDEARHSASRQTADPNQIENVNRAAVVKGALVGRRRAEGTCSTP